MTTIEEITREMELLDEHKHEMSDGEYLEKSNKLMKIYKQLKKKEIKMKITTVRATSVISVLNGVTTYYRLEGNNYVIVEGDNDYL